MLELNHEYTYQEICRKLGWNVSSGAQKIKQIKVLEESYKFYHPENKKTHKPKKSYIFTEQLKEPVISDGRKNNGTESSFPLDEFEYLFKCILVEGVQRNYYFERGIMNEIYVSNALLYKEFGFDIYGYFLEVFYGDFWNPRVNKIKNLFQDICLSAARSATVTRLCRLLGCEKNTLPKGILRHLNSQNTILMPANELMPIYQEYMGEYLREYECRSEIQAIKRGLYFEITDAITDRFIEEKDLYGVRRYNRIEINMDYIMTFKKNANKKWQLQRKFRRVVVESIYQSVRRRCLDLKEYSQKLAPVEKLILLNYFRQMLKKMILMQEYKEKMEQLRTQIEEAYADDEEIIEFIKKRNERIAKEKAREKALAKIRESESKEEKKK
ncbi:hypothetical protein [Blautia massiliensis (ex Durand et al. 2017)]|uniref:hypothetical protein n=1 Tax=Blautia massiliensis (ex Durand et al. 2017) TaxID=1737424 RepID=UPI00156E448A|nr:hypothetical protein [Blautia massiliensis (ex Durand et al. 2017)]NSG60808.1 hypothetical protein [Blautia massiliensis (ex Durand et al. 2017)]NSK94601.1 hypothetical protein [Blautia massiliensis (ex Durand et al. 2017)]